MLRIMSSVAAIGNYIIAALLIVLCCSTTSLAMVVPSPPRETSRRSLLTRVPFAVMGATASLSIGMAPPKDERPYSNHYDDINCQCSKCQHKDQKNKYQSVFSSKNNNNWVVNAYERRDVGDETSSGETKAMNDQAYETNNRLERDGLVLETAAEQSAKLTAALSDYSYTPTPGKATSSKSSRGTKQKQSTKNEE